MKKRFLIALLLLILFSTYNIQFNSNFFSKFYIQKITIENNKIIKEENINNKLSFLKQSNIFLLDKKKIEKKLKEIQFIDSFQIKKVYPNKIIIKITEKKPIAIIQHNKEKKYFTTQGDLIDFIDLRRFEELPFVFGDKKSFSIIYENLKEINFPLDNIQKFYLFETKRWDLLTQDNQLIKLPTNNYVESLKNFMDLKDQVNFTKYKIFDYRIKDQLILK